MQETKDFLKNIIKMLPGHIYWKDKNGVYLGSNEEHIKSLGLNSIEEIIGKTDHDLIWKDNADKLKEADSRVIKEGKVLIFEEVVKLANGEMITFLSKKVPLIDDNGEIIGILGTSVNISNHKALEEQLIKEIAEKEAAEKARSEFMKEASHEIRSHFTNIINNLYFLVLKLDDLQKHIYNSYNLFIQAEKSEVLKNIFNSLDSIRQMHKKCLYASNRGADGLADLIYLHNQLIENENNPHFETVIIKEYVNDIINSNELSKNSNIKIHLDIDDKKVPFSLKLDYINIQYCLKVVIDNALRFSKDNDVVKIHIDYVEDSGAQTDGLLIIKVSDMGEGISEKQLSYIFDVKDYMHLTSNKQKILKPSLRLPLVKKKIECSGGNIKIESKFNYGTTVTLKIPVLNPEFKNFYTQNRENYKDIDKGLVLLVEDEPALRESIKAMLEILNYQVDSVSNSFQALAKIDQGKQYTIMLLDIVLPDMNGIALMNEIKKRIDYNVPFIAQTSRDSEEDEMLFRKEGFMTVLIKPFTIAELKATLEDATLTMNDDDSD